MVLMRTDPFREVDRLAREFFGSDGTMARPTMMPMDAWRDEDVFRIELDLPGIKPESIDLNVENNVVTVRADRPPRDSNAGVVAAERPHGTFSRQLVLGDNLDTSKIDAAYESGVLVLTVPIADSAKPRKIEITSSGEQRQALSA